MMASVRTTVEVSRYRTHQSSKENTSPSRRPPESGQDGPIQIPYVPEVLAEDLGRRARRGAAEEHDEHLAEENASGLGPGGLPVAGGITGDVGLIHKDGAKLQCHLD